MTSFADVQNREAPLSLTPGDDYGAIREHFKNVGYTKEGLRQATHILGLETSANLNVIEVERRLPKEGPLRELIRLFRLGQPLSEKEATSAFQPFSIKEMMRLGLLFKDDQGYRSPFTLNLHEDLYVLGDQPSEKPSPHHVIRLNPSAVVTAAMTPRRTVASALDLGTGNGIQAMLAARHAQQVIATDINPRALNVAAANARLNGIANIEFRLGSWFAPVSHDRFDLIVSNPPFVISPKSQFVYRDSGQPGDVICRMVAQDAAARLHEDGLGVLLGNWPFIPGQDWAAEPKQWLDGCQVDVIALLNQQADPLGYTIHWQGVEHQTWESLAQTTEQWLAYFRERHIQAIATGSLIFRKRANGPYFFTGYDIPDVPATPTVGEHLLCLINHHDRIRAMKSSQDWLPMRLRPHPALRIEQTLTPASGRWEIGSSQARLTTGLAFVAQLNAITQGLLIHLGQASKTVDELIHELSSKHNLSLERMGQTCLDALQYWLLHGMIEID